MEQDWVLGIVFVAGSDESTTARGIIDTLDVFG